MSENVNVEDMAVVESEILDEDDVIKLIKPMGDKTELIFNFDKINGRVLIDCLKKAQREDSNILVPALSMVYQAMVAARALDMRYDDVIGLSGADFTAVTQRVSRFLNRVDR